MTENEKNGIALLTLQAAFCDGRKSDDERAQIRKVFSSLEVPDTASLLSRVVLRQSSLDEAVSSLNSRESKLLAYELAVCVIESDGHRNTDEIEFLNNLAQKLGLESSSTQASLKSADDLNADLPSPPPPATPRQPAQSQELQSTIRNTALLAGALELLPQSVATLAVIPLQTHLVYRIGRSHGYSLDTGHAKELIGTIGIGLTSQAFEGLARKFLGGLVRRAGGGVAGSLASAATGPAVTFATTYALGHVADKYYAGGRSMASLQLKEMFQNLFTQAKAEGEQLLPNMRAQANKLDLTQLPNLIRDIAR